MKDFKINQEVIVPNGRIGKIKAKSGHEATVWFDEAGLDIGYFSLATLNYPPRTN